MSAPGRRSHRRGLFLLVSAFLLVLSAACGLIVSRGWASSYEAMRSLFAFEREGAAWDIVWKLRMPRVFLGIFVGAGLSVSGCIFQAVLRNPLADSYTLGVSAGSALGTTLGVLSGAAALLGFYLYPVFSFAGAMLSIAAVYAIGARRDFYNPTLILSGVILTFMFSSLVLLAYSLIPRGDVQGVVLWLMGDLSGAEPQVVLSCCVFVTCGIVAAVFLSRELDVLTFGDERAASLGLNVALSKKLLFLVASLMTAACVSASGIVGFVGILIPHFVRRFTGPAHRVLLPACCMAGGAFLVAADTLSRTVFYPVPIPVGVICGLFGGGFFLAFLFKARKWEVF